MNILLNYNKRNTFPSKLEMTGALLSVSAGPNQSETTTFDLNEIVAQYSEDHGCVALGSAESGLVWKETTRLSYNYRMPAGRSFSSEFVTGSAVKDDGSQPGASNVASPAWVMSQDNYASLLFILTPHKGCALADCTLIWKAIEGEPDQAQFIIDGQDQAGATAIGSVKDYLASWLPITLTGPDTIATDGTAQFTIGCEAPSDIHITASCGVINRAIAKNGQVLTLDARGLAAGEKVEIKLGYKWWPGASKKVVTVQ
jgi:hypothetical protein